MKKTTTAYARYQLACEELAESFVDMYFEGQDWSWVSDHTGGVLHIERTEYNYYDMIAIAETMELKPTNKQLLAYSDYCESCAEDGEHARSLGGFLRYGNMSNDEAMDEAMKLFS